MIVLEESALSWRTNSRPSPRLAPVIMKTGILNMYIQLSCFGTSVDFLQLIILQSYMQAGAESGY
jgi:hypothetical protein